MKKIVGTIVHILCILAILAAIVEFTIVTNEYQHNLSRCITPCTFQNYEIQKILFCGIAFSIVAMLLYYIGKDLKK
jgi:hypothetical protein